MTSIHINNTTHYVLLLNSAPFFINNLVITRTNNAITSTLVEGEHYWPALPFIGATRATGLAVYGAIYLDASIHQGSFSVSYQVVGGDWILPKIDVQNNLIAASSDPRTISWETLMGLPDKFFRRTVPWAAHDPIGYSEIVDKINEIDTAITTAASSGAATSNLTFAQDAIGSGTSTINLTLKNSGVVPSVYTKFTVNDKGLITSGAEVRSLADLGIAEDYMTQESLDFKLQNEVVQNTHVGLGGAEHAVATTTEAGFMSAADKLKLNKASIFSLSNSTPKALETSASPGISNAMSRSDHVHPQIPEATTTTAGLMSAADKVKLNGIAAGAQVNVVTSVNTLTGSVSFSSKDDFGLDQVDNTSDDDKPVSDEEQDALDEKQDVLFDYLMEQSDILALDAVANSAKTAKATDTRAEFVSDGLNWVEVLKPLGGSEATVTEVRRPKLAAPSNSATGVLLSPLLEANAFSAIYDSDTRVERQFQVTLKTDTAFASVIFDSVSITNTITVSPSLTADTEYIWRCRDKYNTVDAGLTTTKYSNWSAVWEFKTTDVLIATPTFTSFEGSPNSVPRQPAIVMSAFTLTSGTDTHESTTWRILDSTDTEIYINEEDTTNLTSWEVPSGILSVSSTYKFEVTYNGAVVSSAAAVTTVTTLAVFPYDQYLAVAHDNYPFITIYGKGGDTFIKLADPATLPTGNGKTCTFSPDGNHLAFLPTNELIIYKRNGDSFSRTGITITGGVPDSNGGNYEQMCFSNDGVYLAICSNSHPSIFVYKRSGDTFTRISTGTLGHDGFGNGVAFSPNANYMAVAGLGSSGLVIFKRNGDVFNSLGALSSGTNGLRVAFSPDGIYLAYALDLNTLMIYKRNNDTFTNIQNINFNTRGTDVSFSPNGLYLALAHYGDPVIFKRNGDSFSASGIIISGGAIGACESCRFSPDNNYVSFGSINSPFINIYKRNGDTFTKLANPSSLPTSVVLGDSWFLKGFGSTP